MAGTSREKYTKIYQFNKKIYANIYKYIQDIKDIYKIPGGGQAAAAARPGPDVQCSRHACVEEHLITVRQARAQKLKNTKIQTWFENFYMHLQKHIKNTNMTWSSRLSHRRV